MTIVSIILSIIVGFGLGITIESLTNQNLYVITWLVGLALLVAMWWRRASGRARPAPHLALISIVLLCVALGMWRTQLYEAQFDNSLAQLVGTEVELIGLVVRDPDVRTKQQLLTVEYQNERLLVSTNRSVSVAYGDRVSIEGELALPETFTTDLGRTFDYVNYLRAKGIEYRISFADVTVVESRQGNWFLQNLFQFKHWFMYQLDVVFSEPAGALADGLLLGLNEGLGEELEEDFRRSGIIHIVVLSGHNVMLVVAFVTLLLAFFLRQTARLVVGLVAITSFALIVGLSATVVRACIMAGLLLVAQTFGRSYDILRALLVAGLMMLIINPYLLLFDIGFQLSFMATIGLIAALPWLKPKGQPELFTSVRGYIVATIATQIAVLPLLLYQIGEVSLVAVAVNVLVLPMVPAAMLGTFIVGVTQAWVPSLSLLVGYLTELTLTYIIVIAEYFAALPFATVTAGAFSAWWVLVLYALLALGYWWFTKPAEPEDPLAGWEIIDEATITKGAA